MEIINPVVEEFRENKICRLCGSDNKENVHIFTSKPISPRSADILTKILTIYPLVLYKDDPLPQYICPKCIGNVSTTYQDIQQVMRQQNKWMNLTKAAEPEHKYFRILNVVEKATKAAKENIKSLYNIEVNNIPLGKLLALTPRENENTIAPKPTTTEDINDIVVKNIQNKLESNGFTIKRIKVPTLINNNKDFNAIADSAEPSANFVTCSYCNQKFSDLKILAQHQLIHLKLSANKIFTKHLLSKHLRRGRLITLMDNKCIRCLNCWRIYKDNKAILHHWSEGECEFYCYVCGKEFPQSPKMLREHVTEIHGVSYRSIKSEFMASQLQNIKPVSYAIFSKNLCPPSTELNSDIVKKPTYKKPPPKSCTKNDDGTITCKICYKVFDNFRSSNSHMRKHKPPNRFREPFIASSVAMDKYNSEANNETQPSTSKFYFDNKSAPTPLQYKPPRPPYRVIMTNGPLRGIKTKIVQKRQDFLSNYAAKNRHDDDKLIVPELLTPAMKSQHMLNTDTHNNGSNGLEYGEYGSYALTPSIKSEPLENSRYGDSQEPRLCFMCNESFSSTRDYELHAMFVHNMN